MKTPLISRVLLLIVVLLMSAASAAAQSPETFRAGYWTLETNLTTRNYTVVRFYDGQHELVYEERLPDLCLDLSRGTSLCRRTARRLDVALNQLLRQPADSRQNTQLLAQQLGQNRRVQRVYAVR